LAVQTGYEKILAVLLVQLAFERRRDLETTLLVHGSRIVAPEHAARPQPISAKKSAKIFTIFYFYPQISTDNKFRSEGCQALFQFFLMTCGDSEEDFELKVFSGEITTQIADSRNFLPGSRRRRMRSLSHLHFYSFS
jgi:hypothetical protein